MDKILSHSSPDLIILDLAFSPGSDLSITRRLRVENDIPIIIVSFRSEETDRILGLEMGADDYLVKPINPRELLARVRSVLRPKISRERSEAESNVISFEEYRMDLATYSLTMGDEKIDLTTKEFELLRHLVEHPNRIKSREYLADQLGYDAIDGSDRRVDVSIARIRKKIEKDPHHPRFIKTVRGEGYIFS